MRNEKHQLCKTCIYRTNISKSWMQGPLEETIGCVYILHNYKRRGCDWRDCDKYVKGNPKKLHRNYTESKFNKYKE